MNNENIRTNVRELEGALLKLIAGILMPRKGAILMDGKDVTPLPAKDRQLGIVFQSYALFPHMNVFENVGYVKHTGAKIDPDRRSCTVSDLIH